MKEVVVFSAEWCPNCPGFKQALTAKGIEFREVDVDTDEGMVEAQKYQVRGLPTTIILRDGYMERRITGTGNVEGIEKELES